MAEAEGAVGARPLFTLTLQRHASSLETTVETPLSCSVYT